MIPTTALLAVLGGVAALGFAYPLLDDPFLSWPLLFYFVLGLSLGDAARGYKPRQITVYRTVSGTLPVGVPCDVTLTLEGRTSAVQNVLVWDHHPATFECAAMPLSAKVREAASARMIYQALPTARGAHRFPAVELRIRSPIGLWWRKQIVECRTAVKVYPNFSLVTKYIHLGTDARNSYFGVRRLRRRGAGSEFQELRDYRAGDPIRQIDWRATARTRRLISREYQDEKDQRVVFLLDCGRRMRSAEPGGLSHFDESLNAILLLSYMALRQGDAVAIGTFGHDAETSARWMGPIKGPGRTNEVLNVLYDLEPSTVMPDYLTAVSDLILRHRKHALVVLVTNLRGEDAADLLPALRVLRRRHLVVLVSLREPALEGLADVQVNELPDALRVAGAAQIKAERESVMRNLVNEGALAIDVVPGALCAELLNTYLALKASRAL